VSPYPATTHSMASGPVGRLRWMSGSATLTTKKPSTYAKVPHKMTASGLHLATRDTVPALAWAVWLMMVMARATGTA
jgi:hypothetical protein